MTSRIHSDHCLHYTLAESRLAAPAIPPTATHFSVAWSVCQSQSCTVLKLFDGFRCHLAGTLVGSNDTLCQMGVPGRKGDLGSNLFAETCNCFRLTKNNYLWFTRWHHQSAIPPRTKLLLSLLPIKTDLISDNAVVHLNCQAQRYHHYHYHHSLNTPHCSTIT